MIKILNAKQIRELDAYTIQHEPVASIELMERACHAFVRWFVSRFDASNKIGVVCGTGNNGGDGLGIARMLTEWNYPVKVWIVRGGVKETEDFKQNLHRLNNKTEIYEITSLSDKNLFHDRDVLVDAVFGSGLTRPVNGIYAQIIECMNQTETIRVAVDVPSGLFADAHSEGEIIHADFTVTFQLPKLAFFLPENQKYVSDWHVVDIRLDESFIEQAETNYFVVTKKSVKKILKPRLKFAHKGDFGKALLIAGSYGKMGACVLAARAALRAGIGLLTVHVPQKGYSIIQSAVPEAMASVDKENYFFSESPSLASYSVIGIGPGLGQEKQTAIALEKILKEGKPLVIDADALNILASHPHLYYMVPDGSILTPHPGEFARLVGSWSNDFDRLDRQVKLAAQLNSVIILKGANTSIATPEGKVYFNSTGNPGMATGGSGDVLTGILTGLLAQRFTAVETAILGVYLHGASGDLAKYEKGEHSIIASDLIEHLPLAFRFLEKS